MTNGASGTWPPSSGGAAGVSASSGGGGAAGVLELVPGKTDKQLAAEFKQRLAEAHGPVLALLDEMHTVGFEANIACGMGPLGKYVIANLVVFKKF